MSDQAVGPEIAMAGDVADKEQGQDSPFDRLEAKIEALIARYEDIQKDYRACSLQLAERDSRVRQLEEEIRTLEEQRAEVRRRLDALIEKLTEFS
jgi:chromosome segregation ATPase